MILGDTSTYNSHFIAKRLSPHPEANYITILHGDIKSVSLIIFLVQNLITSDNPFSIWLRWLWNPTFWLRVENLKKYRECDKIQYIRVCTSQWLFSLGCSEFSIKKNKKTRGSNMLFIPFIDSLFMNASI